ncbi:uncharacterized protein zgc:193711 [Electrophorus electricus]|uniref:Uncharacterized protein n=1 Tax=Electrophorus electricus TaxID=8005 RepID=A0A4W4GRQ1_ELEEL|nr:uncharacterized protein zgc:193711 [Electrophorus electricus]
MGNSVTKSLDKWGLNSSKFSLKRSVSKAPPAVSPHQAAETHIYDPVAVDSNNAKVNRRREPDTEGLHYADIQVLHSARPTKQEKQRRGVANKNTTEYATIDFLRGVKTPAPLEPADILIPPGDLQRPMAKTRCKKSASSKRAVLV